MTLPLYWTIGVLLVIADSLSMHPRSPLTGPRGFLATLLPCLLWLLALITL